MADYGHYVSTAINTDTTVCVSDGSSVYRKAGGSYYYVGHGPCRTEQAEGKEETEMVDRQTFLDALVIEGRQVTAEELEVIREASDSKWKLLVATLLARAFESSDLALLKEKPKEVVVLKEEA